MNWFGAFIFLVFFFLFFSIFLLLIFYFSGGETMRSCFEVQWSKHGVEL